MRKGVEVTRAARNGIEPDIEIAKDLHYYTTGLSPPLGVRNSSYHVSNRLGPDHELNPDYVVVWTDKPSAD